MNSIKVSSSKEMLELTLNCSHLNKDLTGVVKKIKENNELYIMPMENKKRKAQEFIDKTK